MIEDVYMVTVKGKEPLNFPDKLVLYLYLRKALKKATGEDILTKDKFNNLIGWLKQWEKIHIEELGEDLRRGADYKS